MTEHTKKVAGIDTSKAKLDIAIHGQTDHWQVENTPAGHAELITILTAQQVERVGIEATGGYERGVVASLRKVGFRVSVLQPSQVKAFGQAKIRRAKTDRLDAALIADFVAIMPEDRPAPDPRFAAFADHLTFIEQAEEDIKRAKVRLEHQHDPRLRAMLESDVKLAKARVAAELDRLVADMREHEDIAQRLDLVGTIQGIGLRTAVALIVGMPELGTLSREEAASLAGLAPFEQRSGKFVGEAHIAGGRARVRTALYAAALPAAFQWNPALKALYARLMQKAKKHKVALIACARKLLIYANAVLQRGTPWQKITASNGCSG